MLSIRELRHRLGRGLVSADRHDEARAEFERCLDEPGDTPPASLVHLELGELLAQDEPAAALTHYAEAATSPGQNTEAVRRALQLILHPQPGHSGLSVEPELAQRLEVASKRAVDPSVILLLGLLLASAHRGNEAGACLERAAATGDERVQAWANAALAQLLYSEGHDNEAVDVAERVAVTEVADEGARVWLTLWRSKALLRLQQYEAAMRATDLVATADPPNVQLLAVRAGAQVALADPDGALATLERASEASSLDLQLWRAVACLALGRLEEASKACDVAASIDPSEPATLLLKAQVLFESATAEGATSVRSGIDEGRRLLAAFTQQSLSPSAIAVFFSAQRPKRQDQAGFQYVEAELSHAQHIEPVPLLDRIDLSNTPYELDAAVAWLRGMALEDAAEQEEAADAFEEASDLYRDIDARLAADLLKQAASLADHDGMRSLRAADQLIQLYYREKQAGSATLRRALECFRRWVGAAPESAPVWACTLRGMLSRAMAEVEREGIIEELWRAVAVTEAGEHLGQDDAYRWGHLSVCYELLDLPSAALQAAVRASELDPKDTWLRSQLLIALCNAGDYARAQDVLTDLADNSDYKGTARAIAVFLNWMTTEDPDILAEADNIAREFDEVWFGWLHVRLVILYRGLAAARGELEQIVSRLSDSGLETPRHALALALLGDVAGARLLLDKGWRAGNINVRAYNEARWLIAVSAGDADEAIRYFREYLSLQNCAADLARPLKVAIMTASSTQLGISRLSEQLLGEAEARMKVLQAYPRPWIADLAGPTEGRWHQVSKALARRRFGDSLDPSELQGVRDALREELPPAVVDPAIAAETRGYAAEVHR